MKNLTYFITVSVLILVSTQIYSQEIDFLRKSVEINFPEKMQGPQGNPLLSETYKIGTTGDFPTIDSAFNKLSIDGIAGNVTLELVDTLYTTLSNDYGFFLNGPIPGAGPNSRVIIKPAANKNVTLQGNGYSVLFFYNTSYVTIDGVGLKGATSLRIHSLQNTQYNTNDGITFLNNSTHNVIQNIKVECEDYTRLGCGILLWHYSGDFSPDSNLVQNNFVKKAAIGISVISFFYRVTRDTIRGNIIGSETDSLISLGINLAFGQYTVVENNIIQNIRYSPALVYNPGIVSLAGVGDIIRNNVVHNVKVDSGNYGGIGILLNGTTSYSGVNNEVYNNMIYDIQSTSPETSARVSGIEMRNQSYAKVYFNSVYLSGTGSNPQGSAALYIGNNCSHVYVNNNILVNTRDESPYCASAIYDYSASIYTSDYNDLYYDETNQFNYLIRAGGTDYRTLSDWQAMNKDLNSFTEMPSFAEPHLHIDGSITTSLNSGGIIIWGIDSDFDNDTRNVTSPDIGADEFNGIVDVEEETMLPTEFVLEQNYPNPFNPSTTIKFTIAMSPLPGGDGRGGLVTLKIYDVLGSEVATLINEEKPAGSYEVQFDATSLSSGTYFYRLQVYAPGRAGDPLASSGQSFVETKKMILLK
jgi:hypothetical protein